MFYSSILILTRKNLVKGSKVRSFKLPCVCMSAGSHKFVSMVFKRILNLTEKNLNVEEDRYSKQCFLKLKTLEKMISY